jgi:predicted permease
MSTPVWARALLRLCVPADRREDVLGDLEEVHARRRVRLGAGRAWLVTSAESVVVAGAFLVTRVRGGVSQSLWLSGPQVKLALRLARKQPLLNVAALLALATGIALSGAAFTLVDMAYFSKLPMPAGDRFVRLVMGEGSRAQPEAMEWERFALIRRESHAFDYLGAVGDASMNLADESGAVEVVRGVAVMPDAFRVLPYRPVVGRTLLPEDATPGAPPVVLIGARLWQRRFGSDPSIVGRSVALGGTLRQVVGVMPEEAEFPNRPEVWMPLGMRDFDAAMGPGGERFMVFGVLRKGMSTDMAAARAAALSRRFEEGSTGAPHLRLGVRAFTDVPQSGLMQLLLGGLMAAVLSVLLVIAGNVGNLVSARAAARRQELAVRTALGAGRTRLVTQLFGEVLFLGIVAFALGGWALHRLMSYLSVWLTGDIPFWVEFMPHASTWVFLVLVTLVVCAVAGGVPALRATRTPGDALRSGSRGASAVVFGRGASVVSVLQIAFSVALLGGAVLSMRGMQLYVGHVAALREDRILVAAMPFERAGGRDSAVAAVERIEAVARALPGVEHAGIATQVPRVEASARPVVVEPAPGEPEAEPRPAPVVEARPGFLEALGARPVLGRMLEKEDLLPGAQAVAVVNEGFVEKFLHGRNPLGRRVQIVSPRRAVEEQPAAPQWRTIVGVVPDLGLSVGDPDLDAGFYVPLTEPSWGYLTLSVAGDPTALVEPLRRALMRADPAQLVPSVYPLDQAASGNAQVLALFGGMLGAMGAMALLLSVVSTYALVSFTVSRRVREVGIRVALGASRASVLGSVAGRAVLQVVLGAALGAPLGLLVLQMRHLFVLRVPVGESWLLLVVSLVMLGAGALASWLPARRALAVGPAEALRAE